MLLVIFNDRTIAEIQQEFSKGYPYLKLEFYKRNAVAPISIFRKPLVSKMSLSNAGLTQAGTLYIKEEMTVAEIEDSFLTDFGLEVQICRKAANHWLEISVTDSWSIAKQNQHGMEISLSMGEKEINE